MTTRPRTTNVFATAGRKHRTENCDAKEVRAGERGGGEPARGVEQRADDARVQEAAVLTELVAPCQMHLDFTRARGDELETEPPIERRRRGDLTKPFEHVRSIGIHVRSLRVPKEQSSSGFPGTKHRRTSCGGDRSLRAALGLGSQEFTTEQFVGMISEEIEQLRAAGKTDADIAQILARDVGVRVSTDSIQRYYSAEAVHAYGDPE